MRVGYKSFSAGISSICGCAVLVLWDTKPALIPSIRERRDWWVVIKRRQLVFSIIFMTADAELRGDMGNGLK
jgi:hypothetical protein